MAKYEFFLVSSLEKVFADERPHALTSPTNLYTFANVKTAIQLVYTAYNCKTPDEEPGQFQISVDGSNGPVRMETVELMPCSFPCYNDADDGYLRKAPGMYPDLLLPVPDNNRITPIPNQYRSVWITFLPGKTMVPLQTIQITVRMCSQVMHPNGFTITYPEASSHQYTMNLLLHTAPAINSQTLLHTEWFHTDCLAEFYNVEPFSTKHWNIIDQFMQSANDHGINMLLTPVFTPPLDTVYGKERMTIQLVDISMEQNQYHFQFTKLKKWLELCMRNNISFLEIAHFFTQWGAKATPKIVVTVDGVEQKLFGWDVSSASPEYKQFLDAFVPAFIAFLEENGFDKKHVYYHISDEPAPAHLDSYQTAKSQIKDLLEGCELIDAVSNLEFYKQGIVKQPVVANNHIAPFIEADVPDLWVYYCCVQSYKVPNRFFALPSARNRIMGVLMYLYHIKGFLHWGFNFYHSQCSVRTLNPFAETDCGKVFPSGDPFLVYPGPDGKPLSSIRAEVQDDAMYDLRALNTLEEKYGREAVEKIIYEDIPSKKMTFMEYPTNADYLENLRKKMVEWLML